MIGIQHFRHHGRFYLAAIAGIVVWFAALALPWPLRALVSGDAFFCVYLAAMIVLASQVTPDGLRQRAGVEDEGILLIMLLALAAVVFSLGAIFMVLNRSDPEPLELVLAVASVPLGWLVLHTIAAFHYAHLYYSEEDSGCLAFPGEKDPGAWDFLYFSFVVGMTAQVSDVAVNNTDMRWRVLAHGIIAFFYNTVLLALAVNAAVTLANRAG
jgi:uncharacterized membrane protein